MRVSIVTISYNQGQFLEKAILSVLNQGHPDVEYIVVDPGSTDGSRDIIEIYRDRIQHIIYEKDDGPADGLNKGFSYATGDVLGFLNADDELLPNALQVVAQYFEQTAEVDVMCGGGYFISGDGNLTKRVMPTLLTKLMYAYGAVTFLQQATFFRRTAFLDAGGFNPANRTCWDGELFLDMALKDKRFGVVNQSLALFRIHGGSITGSARLLDRYLADNKRLFIKAIGRERKWFDVPIAFLLRVWKLVAHPSRTVLMIANLWRVSKP